MWQLHVLVLLALSAKTPTSPSSSNGLAQNWYKYLRTCALIIVPNGLSIVPFASKIFAEPLLDELYTCIYYHFCVDECHFLVITHILS